MKFHTQANVDKATNRKYISSPIHYYNFFLHYCHMPHGYFNNMYMSAVIILVLDIESYLLREFDLLGDDI